MGSLFHIADGLHHTDLHIITKRCRILRGNFYSLAKFPTQESATLTQALYGHFDTRRRLAVQTITFAAVQVATHTFDHLVDIGAEKILTDAQPAREQVVESDNTRQQDREHHHATRLVGILQGFNEYVMRIAHNIQLEIASLRSQ